MIEALKKNLIFVIALVVIAGTGIVWFLTQSGGEEALDTAGVINQPSQYAEVRAQILSTIATLEAVQLDVSVLDDPSFRALMETPRPTIQPPTIKHRNPFIP